MIIKILLFYIGASLGSFFALILDRRSRNLGCVKGRSNCNYCGEVIPFYLNIPIVSYLYLKGRCNFCGEKISFYNFVYEIIFGFIVLFLNFNRISALNIIRVIYIFLILLIIILDVKEHNIYIIDLFCLIIINIIRLKLEGVLSFDRFLYGFILAILFYTIYKLTNAMGQGDIILSYAIGIEAKNIIEIFKIFRTAFILAGIISLILIFLKIKTRKDYIAFAPYLIIAGILLNLNIV